MSVNNDIITAISELDVPVFPDFYDSKIDRYDENGNIYTTTNKCGGILGGITDGMPITFKVAVKPTASIAQKQDTINLETHQNDTLEIKGRHDPCQPG